MEPPAITPVPGAAGRIKTLAMMDADRYGEAALDVLVPPSLTGTMIWTQVVEILGTGGRFSNPLAELVQ